MMRRFDHTLGSDRAIQRTRQSSTIQTPWLDAHTKRDSKVLGQNRTQYDLKRRKERDMLASDLPALMVSVVGPVMAGSSRAQVLVKGVESDIVREYTLVVITVPL